MFRYVSFSKMKPFLTIILIKVNGIIFALLHLNPILERYFGTVCDGSWYNIINYTNITGKKRKNPFFVCVFLIFFVFFAFSLFFFFFLFFSKFISVKDSLNSVLFLFSILLMEYFKSSFLRNLSVKKIIKNSRKKIRGGVRFYIRIFLLGISCLITNEQSEIYSRDSNLYSPFATLLENWSDALMLQSFFLLFIFQNVLLPSNSNR